MLMYLKDKFHLNLYPIKTIMRFRRFFNQTIKNNGKWNSDVILIKTTFKFVHPIPNPTNLTWITSSHNLTKKVFIDIHVLFLYFRYFFCFLFIYFNNHNQAKILSFKTYNFLLYVSYQSEVLVVQSQLTRHTYNII